MKKIFFVFIFLQVLLLKSFAQKDSTSTLTAQDSINILRELMAMLDSADRPQSYVFANIGIGNRLFSSKNDALNAKQDISSTLIYSPSLAYYHKSGFNITAGASLLNDGERFGVNQYSITPAFDLVGNKKFGVSISYTHYFVQDKFSEFSSPIQDDFFSSFTYKKLWLQPGIAFGYSTGEYKETQLKDTIINGRMRHQYDSMTNHLSAFSMMLTASHEFSWYGVLNKKDGLALTPTLLGNAGSANINTTHKTNAPRSFGLTGKNKIPKLQTVDFAVQSVGLNIDLNYSIGHLTLQPQLYLDYYLPETESERLTQVFTFNIGYTF